MTDRDAEILRQFEPIAEKLREKLAPLSDGSFLSAVALNEEMHHQFLHWMDAHRSELSEELQQQLDDMPRPEPHLMHPAHPELGIPNG